MKWLLRALFHFVRTVTVWETVSSGIEKVVDGFDQRKKTSYDLNRSCNERFLVRAQINIVLVCNTFTTHLLGRFRTKEHKA
jgi:hypothetical protein